MTAAGVLVRTFACFALVFATWNPTGYSYLTWARYSLDATAPEIAVAGAALLALHILFVRIAWLSLGPDGITGALAILLIQDYRYDEPPLFGRLVGGVREFRIRRHDDVPSEAMPVPDPD